MPSSMTHAPLYIANAWYNTNNTIRISLIITTSFRYYFIYYSGLKFCCHNLLAVIRLKLRVI